MSKRFHDLEIPHQWKNYWTKYPHGFTIYEALIDWINKVNDMVKNVNDWNEYLDDFVGRFDDNLAEEVINTLKEWQESGFLEVIINQALETRMDDLEEDLDNLNQAFTNFKNLINTDFTNFKKQLESDLEDFKGEIDQDIGEFKSEVNQDLDQLKDDIYLGDDITSENLVLNLVLTYNTPAGFKGLQGGYVDRSENMLYFGMNTDGATARLVKYNLSTNSILATKDINGYHCNDITLGHDGYLYIALLDDPYGKYVARVNKNTLDIVDTKNLNHDLSCIDYDSTLKRYVTGKGQVATIWDNTLTNRLDEFIIPTKRTTPQGIAFVKNKYIFKAESHGNRITVTTVDGRFVKHLMIEGEYSGELEFISQDGTNSIIMGFNAGGRTIKIYRSSIAPSATRYWKEGDIYYDQLFQMIMANSDNGKRSMMPGFNFLTNTNKKFNYSTRSYTLWPKEEVLDYNDITASGFYYMISNLSTNAPYPNANFYLLVIGSTENTRHTVQLAMNTGRGNYKIYIRKGIEENGVVEWGSWGTIAGTEGID